MNTLARTTFSTSRLAEFCSEQELTAQTGHPKTEWPYVVLKELVDNALDAAEEASVAPSIEISVEGNKLTVSDNGPGISAETVRSVRDYLVRVSSRAAYVSPTRGAQGNALKTILAMAYALDGERGETTIEAQGVAHSLVFGVDQVRQEPKITHTEAASTVKIGTKITVRWPDSSWSILANAEQRFLQKAADYTWINPHLSLKVEWNGKQHVGIEAFDSNWAKWLPSDPTSPHWYDRDRLTRLIGAYVGRDRDRAEDRTVREFVSEFRGLSGSAKGKAVLEEADMARMSLSSLFGIDDRVDDDAIDRLLAAMQSASRAIKPLDLGVIGREHLAACFEDAGADLESFRYQRVTGEHDGLPYVVEAAFGWCPDGPDIRRIITGINWSVGINNPFLSVGGWTGSLDSILTEQRAGSSEPIIIVFHLAIPRVEFLDRGKAGVSLPPSIGAAIVEATRTITKEWCKQRKAEERSSSAENNRRARLVVRKRESIKGVAWEVMERAYLKASHEGTLPAEARQVMYAARKEIQDRSGKPLGAKYFTGTLLPDYLNEHQLDWDVVFSDRGHFAEPHTGIRFGLGTVATRDYISTIHPLALVPPSVSPAGLSTRGPSGAYGGVLFVEKEGFDPLFECVQLASRFDIAIASTKGVSVTAFRSLIDHLATHQIPCFVLHDFDKAGMNILSTLQRATRRYEFKNNVEVIDIGLRLSDVRELELESMSESAARDKSGEEVSREGLMRDGCTEEEAEFLLRRRVEINALSSDRLVAFVERKLEKYGVKKIVPDEATLTRTFKLFCRGRHIEKILEREISDGNASYVDDAVPPDLEQLVRDKLAKNPRSRWDDAVSELVAKADRLASDRENGPEDD